jgi:hypothetical protein
MEFKQLKESLYHKYYDESVSLRFSEVTSSHWRLFDGTHLNRLIKVT